MINIYLIELFNSALKTHPFKCTGKTRVLNETDYFIAYLEFLSNSTYYSRFTTAIKGHKITGKYLNEKVKLVDTDTFIRLDFSDKYN